MVEAYYKKADGLKIHYAFDFVQIPAIQQQIKELGW